MTSRRRPHLGDATVLLFVLLTTTTAIGCGDDSKGEELDLVLRWSQEFDGDAGSLPDPDATTSFPQTMLVDTVRVYGPR